MEVGLAMVYHLEIIRSDFFVDNGLDVGMLQETYKTRIPRQMSKTIQN